MFIHRYKHLVTCDASALIYIRRHELELVPRPTGCGISVEFESELQEQELQEQEFSKRNSAVTEERFCNKTNNCIIHYD